MVTALTADRQAIIEVFATTSDGTRAALAAAVPLARGARARLIVTVPQIVPYPLALERPDTSRPFVVARYRRLLNEMEAGADAHINVCLCRRLADAIARGLSPGATVVIGGRSGRWMSSREQRLARDLTSAGYRVLFAAIPWARRNEPRAAPRVAAIIAAGSH